MNQTQNAVNPLESPINLIQVSVERARKRIRCSSSPPSRPSSSFPHPLPSFSSSRELGTNLVWRETTIGSDSCESSSSVGSSLGPPFVSFFFKLRQIEYLLGSLSALVSVLDFRQPPIRRCCTSCRPFELGHSGSSLSPRWRCEHRYRAFSALTWVSDSSSSSLPSPLSSEIIPTVESRPEPTAQVSLAVETQGSPASSFLDQILSSTISPNNFRLARLQILAPSNLGVAQAEVQVSTK